MNTEEKEIIHWGCQTLLSLGYTLKNDLPEIVQSTPWSFVVRFETSDGVVYMKHTPELLALEPVITQMLRDQFHAAVPIIIASNSELYCFLMKDAGRPLREILKQKFEPSLLSHAIDQFTSLQLAVADHVKLFLDIGVPDWRLDILPDLYRDLLRQKDILIADGLSENDIHELEKQLPAVSNLCKKLSEYAIKPSLVQCDFHDNNILIAESSQAITFIDLGEIVMTHPFFSLVGCLRQMKKHHGLKEEDSAYALLLDVSLKNFMIHESKKRLLDAFMIAQRLWIIYEALAQYRLMLACDKAKFLAFQRHGKLRDALKEFLTAD